MALLCASAALVVVVGVALAVGKFRIAPGDLVVAVGAALGWTSAAVPSPVNTVLWNIRLPRVLAGVVCGAGLSAAGVTYQAMFRNPLVSPDILGVSAGAGFGALLRDLRGLAILGIQAAAFVAALLAVGLVLAVAARVRRHDPVLVLVLAGVAVGTLLAAGSALLKILADPTSQLPAMTYWLLGGLSAVTSADLRAAAPVVIVAAAPLWLLRWKLNVLSTGDEDAMALGVHVRSVRLVAIGASTLITAAVVSISGTIGWIGLVVPHVARLLVGPDLRRMFPMSILLGGTLLVGADTLARTAATIEIPLGILTAIAGAPCLLWLMARSRRAW